ncbi:MAG: hypothetical protein ACKPEQ_05355, partial [Dolichospermum sp.]
MRKLSLAAFSAVILMIASSENGKQINRSSTWYMTDTSFAIDGTAANLLKNAPKKEIRMRLVFENGDTRIV